MNRAQGPGDKVWSEHQVQQGRPEEEPEAVPHENGGHLRGLVQPEGQGSGVQFNAVPKSILKIVPKNVPNSVTVQTHIF